MQPLHTKQQSPVEREVFFGTAYMAPISHLIHAEQSNWSMTELDNASFSVAAYMQPQPPRVTVTVTIYPKKAFVRLSFYLVLNHFPVLY